MEEYTGFAGLYDTFMDNVPYREWVLRAERLIKKYGISLQDARNQGPDAQEKNLIVDLGCGTGTADRMLAGDGYSVIGIDLSPDMLAVAMEGSPEGILYLQQDMRDFELYGDAGAFVSFCDSVNYLLTEEDLQSMFAHVYLQLLPGGVFVFDFNTLHKYRDVIGSATIAEERESESFIWTNTFLEEVSREELFGEEETEGPDTYSNINIYDVSFYSAVPELGEDIFRREQEEHLQRGWTFEEMKAAGEKAGLSFITAMDSDGDGPITGETQRIVMVFKKV